MSVDTRTYRIVEVAASDRAALDAIHDLHAACQAHDRPDLPPPSRRRLEVQLSKPRPGCVDLFYLAYCDGTPVGTGYVSLPQRDNLSNATCEISVHPAHRRQGAGRAIYEQIVEYARAAGRTRLMADTVEPLPDGPDVPSGSPFARAMGMRDVLREVRRRLDLSTADISGYDTLLADAWRHADGYSVIRWRDRAPDEYVADVAYLDGRLMSDSPLGDLDWEPENIDAARIREGEARRLMTGDSVYNTAMRHDASNRLVAWTALALEEHAPDHAWQQITIVDPEHRGHRLGTIVKIENLRYARAGQPALRAIDTWNAAVNDFMISINEAMGFRPADHSVDWQQSI